MDGRKKDDFVGRHLIVDASTLRPVRLMKEFLRRRQLEESGVTGVSIWAESHAAIHTWDEDNDYALDAFSCRDFQPKDALRLLLTHFDVETLNCVNLLRFQRSIPRVSNFQVDSNWNVLVGGRVVGELDSLDFRDVCGAPTPPAPVPSDEPGHGRANGNGVRHRKPATRPGRRAKGRTKV